MATVVVVREPKNGKPTLVNGLVERPRLSPVGYAAATVTSIALRHGSPGARAALVSEGDADDGSADHLLEPVDPDNITGQLGHESQHPALTGHDNVVDPIDGLIDIDCSADR